MKLETDDLSRLLEHASRAAREAGALIAKSRPAAVAHKATGESDASRVVTEIDRQAEDLILASLLPTIRPFDLAVLSEERPDSRLRLEKEHFWCIDPLDGTLPFIEGKAGFAVSIALVSRAGVPLLGAVFDPVAGILYESARGLGITRDGRPWKPRARHQRLSLFLDRSFADSHDAERTVSALEQIAADMGLDGLNLNDQAGAVINACQVLETLPACYFKFPKLQEGGGSLWDFAATACLFGEAGAVATDIHGNPLDLNRADSTFMNHRGVVFASDAALANRIRALYVSS